MATIRHTSSSPRTQFSPRRPGCLDRTSTWSVGYAKSHNSVNASSSASTDALFKVFNFQFAGNLTITETCPMNGTFSSQIWTFMSQAKLKLPLVCSLRSIKINCDSVKLHSSRTEEIHLSQYRMEIIEQKLEEEKIKINSTIFVKSNIDS